MEYVEFFYSLRHLSDTINSRSTNKPFKDYYRTDSSLPSILESDGRTMRTGTKSYAEADSLLREGDYESLKMLNEFNLPNNIKRTSMYKTQVRKSVCGSLPNVPLCLRGVPTNMLDFRRTKVPGRTIDIIVNAGVGKHVSAEDIIKAGSLITSAIKEIEERGIRVNLYTIICSKGDDGSVVEMVVNLKKSESPLNMLGIAYPLINPSFLRRIFFRFLETIPVKELDIHYIQCYGSVVSVEDCISKSSNPRMLSFKEAIKIDLSDLCDLPASTIKQTIISQLKMN